MDGSQYADDTPKVDLSFFGILHTWGETLIYHPHIHFIVAGAAIMGDTIIEPKYNSKFLFPVKTMSKVFRGKFIEGILLSLFVMYNNNTNIKSIKTTTISLLSKNKKSVKQSCFFIKYLHCLFKIIAISYMMSNSSNTITAHSTKKLHRQ